MSILPLSDISVQMEAITDLRQVSPDVKNLCREILNQSNTDTAIEWVTQLLNELQNTTTPNNPSHDSLHTIHGHHHDLAINSCRTSFTLNKPSSPYCHDTNTSMEPCSDEEDHVSHDPIATLSTRRRNYLLKRLYISREEAETSLNDAQLESRDAVKAKRRERMRDYQRIRRQDPVIRARHNQRERERIKKKRHAANRHRSNQHADTVGDGVCNTGFDSQLIMPDSLLPSTSLPLFTQSNPFPTPAASVENLVQTPVDPNGAVEELINSLMGLPSPASSLPTPEPMTPSNSFLSPLNDMDCIFRHTQHYQPPKNAQTVLLPLGISSVPTNYDSNPILTNEALFSAFNIIHTAL